MSNRPKPPGSIDFELTDIDEARRILELPPEGLSAAQELAPDYWTVRRRSPLPSDRALTGPTMDWMMSLPVPVRPLKLSERFPRVANTIAQAWANPEHCASLLAGLLTDKRGKRRGFPIEVQLELERLGAHRATGA